jgi:primary-amine oxidase
VSSRSTVFIFAVFLFALPTCHALQPEVHHPLDALTPQEYWRVYHVLSDAGKLGEKTEFSSILLREPPKAEVLAWKPGMPIVRKVDVVLLTEGKSYAAVVDVSSGKLESWAELSKDQTPGSGSGFDDILKKDPRVLAALKSRGITDLRLVICGVSQAGFVDLPEQTEGRRIGWGSCEYIADRSNGWDDHIAGLFFVVDMTTKKILRVSDSGAVPMPPSTSIYDADGGPAAPGTRPIVTSQPKGRASRSRMARLPGRTGSSASAWTRAWVRLMNLVTYMDAGKRRSVLYEGSLAEMYVPYQDPDENWKAHVFLGRRRVFCQHWLGRHHQAAAGRRRLPGLRHLLQRARSFAATECPMSVPGWLACLSASAAIRCGVTGTISRQPSPAGPPGSSFSALSPQ